MSLLTSACVVFAGALLVTAVDPQARAATLFATATPVVLGIAIAIVLVAAIATITATGRRRPIAGVGLVHAALVLAVAGIGLLTTGPSTMTVGVVLLPTLIGPRYSHGPDLDRPDAEHVPAELHDAPSWAGTASWSNTRARGTSVHDQRLSAGER